MSLIIYADPHIGLNRTNNTTPRSRRVLRDTIYYHVKNIFRDFDHQYICLGDLFDNYSNPESVICDGEEIIYKTNLTLAGNHDVVADADKMGSLELLKAGNKEKIMYAPFGSPYSRVTAISNIVVVGVPHVTTQDLFEESLSDAIERGEWAGKEYDMPRILILHCNYNSPHELTETSLNLTPEHVEELLEVFDYIFLGHEHQPRDLYDGRLVILGNTHPTGFSDISDKRIAILDNVGGKLQLNFETIWSKEGNYVEFDVSQGFAPVLTKEQFVRITGEVRSDQLSELAKMVGALWKNSPHLLAVKSEAKVVGIDNKAEEGTQFTAETLPNIISAELKTDPAMLAMWEEFTQ